MHSIDQTNIRLVQIFVFYGMNNVTLKQKCQKWPSRHSSTKSDTNNYDSPVSDVTTEPHCNYFYARLKHKNDCKEVVEDFQSELKLLK